MYLDLDCKSQNHYRMGLFQKFSHTHTKIDAYSNPVINHWFRKHAISPVATQAMAPCLDLQPQSAMSHRCMINCAAQSEQVGCLTQSFSRVFNALGPKWNGYRFAYNIFKFLFLVESTAMIYKLNRMCFTNVICLWKSVTAEASIKRSEGLNIYKVSINGVCVPNI